jgi:folate-binding protein YgfZ
MFSLDQYDAAHESAVIIARSSRGKVAVSGADRASFLHALLTNDIARLTKGTGAYSAYLTPQGRMISDMRVIETGDRMLLDVDDDLAGPLAERLDRLIFSEDVQVRNVSQELAEVGLHGPSAAAVIERATGVSAAGLGSQYDNLRADAAGMDLTVVRDDSLGLTGFDLYLPHQDADRLRAALAEAGGVPCSEETAEVLRIEAGRPRFGLDMSTETIPLEAGIEDRAISFTKGCYVGQEVIVRVMHRGHGRVARRLVGLVLPGGQAPWRGDAILMGEQKVGEITSVAESPLMGAPIALGYVHRDHAIPGTDLVVKGSTALVHRLPFTKP